MLSNTIFPTSLSLLSLPPERQLEDGQRIFLTQVEDYVACDGTDDLSSLGVYAQEAMCRFADEV